ncbi:mas-related G-protein coupled receptor member H-like [Microcaecilia unicolor]|uniref:Mas-related G-protein coupled receptor member H-like n=1 Tax=Microcaecilia unicolor TaxID=1415580 RepID=A0A6P7X3P8_9AMPH|nr:mas-related G-protein coupled receptor member H-like [Microcaecilia unicolor]
MEGMTTAPSNVTQVEVFNVTDGPRLAVPRTDILLGLSFTCLLIAFCGLLGNSIVIWFLGFRIPKNKFTVYILNLAIADFLFLMTVWAFLVYILYTKFIYQIPNEQNKIIHKFMWILNETGFNAGIYLLMAVSIERCLCALYPFWFRCRRPKYQSTIVCILLWALSFLVVGLEQFICKGVEYPKPGSEPCTTVYLITSTLFMAVVLLMILSSLILIVTIQNISVQCQPSRFYIAIIASVVIFLISVVPERLLGLLIYFQLVPSYSFMYYFFYVIFLSSSFNCAANPFIYFLVGGLRRRKLRGSFSTALQRVFSDETET